MAVMVRTASLRPPAQSARERGALGERAGYTGVNDSASAGARRVCALAKWGGGDRELSGEGTRGTRGAKGGRISERQMGCSTEADLEDGNHALQMWLSRHQQCLLGHVWRQRCVVTSAGPARAVCIVMTTCGTVAAGAP